MKDGLITGITFGLTSAVITTMGLMVGLHSGTRSSMVVLGGILTIAIADAFSDALGIHISEEAKNMHDNVHIWISTLTTFLAKFFCAMTFAVPVILFSIDLAVLISLVWGLTVLSILSYVIARAQDEKPYKIVGEHVLIAVVVVIITHWVGLWVSTFGGQ
ncbi:MAG: hypothetical protein ACLFV2_02605 [Desulfurivibrionaceae bacterium]